MNLHFLIYISTSIKLMSQDELASILSKSRQNNSAKNITGILLYSEGVFMQALEGDENDVQEIYTAITKDSRHKNIIKLTNGPLNERNFPQWSMGFVALQPEKMLELESYINPLSEKLFTHDSAHPALIILKTFVEHNNLSAEK